MIIAKVIGHVVATRKNEKLTGSKFLIVSPFAGFNAGSKLVAVDNVGAGIGETVLVSLGSAAKTGTELENAPIDALIVGIVDDSEKIVMKT